MSRLFLLVLSLLLTACANRPARPSTSSIGTPVAPATFLSATELDTLRADTLRAFRAGDFAALDATATRLRAERPRTPDGGEALAWFYDSFAPETLNLPRLEALTLFTNWERSPSGSVSPTRAAATALYWRKQDTSGTTPETRATWSRARSAALKTDLPDSACPHLAIERHLRLTSRDADRQLATRIYTSASAAFPAYAPLVEAHAGWLSGFADPEVGPWLAAECDKLGGFAGDELYAVVAISRPRSSFDWVAKRNLDWPRIQRGLESIHSRWPAASGTIDRLAVVAESHRDRRTLRAALLRIESAPHRPAWSDNKGAYLRARRFAGLEKPSDLAPAFSLDLKLRPYRVAFSPDGRTVVVGCAKGEVLAFSTSDLAPLWQLKAPRWISSLAFSPDGRLLAATGGNHYAPGGGGLWVWNTATRELVIAQNDFPQRLVTCSFSPDGKILWAGGGVGKNGLLLRWSPGEKSVLNVAPPRFSFRAIKSLAAADDAVLFTEARNVWRLPSAPADATPVRLAQGAAYNSIALSPDRRLLAAGDWHANEDWDKTAALHLVDSAAPPTQSTPVPPLHFLQGTRVEGISFARDAAVVAACSSAADFAVWRLPDNQPLLHAYVDDAWTIDDLGLSPDGERIATVDTGGHLRLWLLSAPARPAILRAPASRWPVK